MSFSFGFIISIFFHFSLIIISFYSAKNHFNNQPKKIQRPKAKIITSVVQVDIVAMPELSLKELKKTKIDLSKKKLAGLKIKEKVVKKVEPKKKVAVVKKEKLKQKPKKKVKKIKSIKKKLPPRKVKKTSFQEKLGRLVLKGNIKQDGNSSFGEAKASQQVEWDDFGIRIVNLIKPYWELPKNIIGVKKPCLIKLILNKNGTVQKTEFVEKSENEIVNNRALRAIELAKPFFPIHNNSILKRVQSGELILAFPF